MVLTVLEDSDVQGWHEASGAFPASPFITAPWLESFRTPHRTPVYFRFVRGEETVGVLAGLVLEPPYRILNRIDRAIFFFSGPAVRDASPELVRKCLVSLVEYSRGRGFTSLELKSWDYPLSYDLGSLQFHREVREEYVLSLEGTFADVQRRIKRTIKRKVRAAERLGLTFEECSDPELVPTLVKLLDETKSTRLSRGHDEYSYHYIRFLDEAVLENLLEQQVVKICCARDGAEVLSAMLMACHCRRAYGLMIGISPRGYESGANAFLLVRELECLHQLGYEAMNLGGVPSDSGDSGLTFFKEALGGERRTCVGGATPFLQSFFWHVLSAGYRSMAGGK